MTTILLVDDSAEIRAVLRCILEGTHFIREAADGESALFVPLGARDLVLLDVMLPGMDGFQVLSHFHARGRSGPSVIMVTARCGELDRRKALLLGAAGFIVKPFDPAEVEREIDRVLRASYEGVLRKRDDEVYVSRLVEQLDRTTHRIAYRYPPTVQGGAA